MQPDDTHEVHDGKEETPPMRSRWRNPALKKRGRYGKRRCSDNNDRNCVFKKDDDVWRKNNNIKEGEKEKENGEKKKKKDGEKEREDEGKDENKEKKKGEN